MRFAIATILYFALITNAIALDKLPSSFIELTKISPSILVNIKYASSNNMFGKRLAGIKRNRAIVTLDVAKALNQVQQDLIYRGYSLVVYNAYMPMQAYEEIIKLTNQGKIAGMRELYFPKYSLTELVENGFLTEKIDYTRGSTIAVTTIPLNRRIQDTYAKKRKYTKNNFFTYFDDGTTDMGTSFDLLDEFSYFDCDKIGESQMNNRELLKEAMQNHGFRQSNRYWWKFTYVRETFLDSNFDFDV